MSQTIRWAARAASLCALTVPVVLASAAPSLATEGGVNPATTPLTFPGTTTQAHGWKLTGAGAATNVQVAPRWVISSRHAGLNVGATYRAPTGQSSRVVAYYQPTQGFASAPGGTADISVSLLESAIAAPTGGFPNLLTDRITGDLQSVLPGYVLWSGQGAATAPPVPSAGWARPDGLSYPGSRVLNLVGGDSGSTGFLYPTATSRPLMPGVVKYAAHRPAFGTDVRFAEPLAPSATEAHATVAAWTKAQFAKHPTATPPSFTTFSGAGVSLSSLRPMAPRNISISAVTPTSVSLAWEHPKDTRVPRWGYRVKIAPSGRVVTLTASTSAYTVTGLPTGIDHTFTVKAVNLAGESPIARSNASFIAADAPESAFREPDSVKYRTRAVPGAVEGLTLTTERASGANTAEYGGGKAGADYCVVATWSAAQPGAGSTITRYETRVNGVLVTSVPTQPGPDPSIVPGADGKFSVKRCGLQAATSTSVQVLAKSDLSVGPATRSSITTLAGVPAGTPFTKPVLTHIDVSSASGEVCVTATWVPPTPMDGFPVEHYSVLLHTTDYAYVRGSDALSADTRSTKFCGVPGGGRDAKLVLYADRGSSIITSTETIFGV